MRPGGREKWPIKIIETAGQTLERALVKTDPFGGNKCEDKTCLPSKNPKNTISCRKNNVGYKISCKKCQAAYIGETGENMHTRMKSHLTKFYSKTKHISESSAFIKHLSNSHGGFEKGRVFEEYFDIKIVKSYKKPLTRCVEEGTFIVNFEGEVLNSKNEWHQPRIIRTTVVQGGAEMAGNRVPSYQRDGRQPESQSSVESAVNVEIVVNVQNVQNTPGTPSVARNTRSNTRARTDRASQARAPGTI